MSIQMSYSVCGVVYVVPFAGMAAGDETSEEIELDRFLGSAIRGAAAPIVGSFGHRAAGRSCESIDWPRKLSRCEHALRTRQMLSDRDLVVSIENCACSRLDASVQGRDGQATVVHKIK